jgi:hypothetical protein
MQRDDQALTVVGSGAVCASGTPPASLGWSSVGSASTPTSLGRHLGGRRQPGLGTAKESQGSAKGKYGAMNCSKS